MTAKELREILATVPDDTPILMPAPDHSYGETSAEVGTALLDEGVWTEDYGEETTPESEYGKRLQVIIINSW